MNLKELLEYNKMEHITAYHEGRQAGIQYHRSGQGSQDPAGGKNPHKEGTEEHKAWNHGWKDSYNEYFPAPSK